MGSERASLADESHYYSSGGIKHGTCPPGPSKEELTTAVSAIHAMYNAGVPLYNRETLASVSDQIENAKNGRLQSIDVKGMTGETVKFDVETGRVHNQADERDLEHILAEPDVGFRTYEDMTSNDEWNSYPLLTVAFCTLYITHRMVWRDYATKEPLKPTPPIPLSITRTSFLKTQQQWRDSAACRKLESFLSQKLPSQTDTVVAFAFGSISFPDRRAEASMFQHALAQTVRDVIKARDHLNTVNCYSQDPVYNATDKSVLGENGITVLENPRAFLEVTDSSVVISCSPDIPVKQIVADLARPAALIWNQVRPPTPGILWTDPDSPRVQQFIRDHYEEFPFEGDEEAFGNLAVYIRKADKS